jgi:predicted DNA-binding ribbon-helix-helix protein
MAAREGFTTNQLIARLHDELSEDPDRDGVTNFASFLRVCCLRYLFVRAGRLPEAAGTGAAAAEEAAGAAPALRAV